MALNYTHMAVDGEPVVFFRAPMIEDLAFEMDYDGWLITSPIKGHLKLELEETYVLLTTKLRTAHDGVLYPELHDLHVDFGNSNIYTEGWWK